MQNFDLPKKDKNGRPINAEDAEARAAAKELRRQRDAENKAKAEARKQEQAKTQQEVKTVPAEEKPASVETPAKKKRKKKKKKPVESAPAAEASTVVNTPVESSTGVFSRLQPQISGFSCAKLTLIHSCPHSYPQALSGVVHIVHRFFHSQSPGYPPNK